MRVKAILILILMLGLFLRVWQVENNPPGLTWDEAALGYNAYSILKTGRDEYGKFLPLQLKSFGDYKPALVSYLVIPTIWLLGLNEFSLRLPAVLFGVGSIWLTYLVVLQLMTPKNIKDKKVMGLFAALAICLSPPAIQFSRALFESNVALFLNLAGTLLLLKGIKNPKWFIFAVIVFVASLYTYQSSRLFVPALLISLVWGYKANIKLTRSFILASIVLGLSLALLGYSIFFKGENKRLVTLNVFSYHRSSEEIDQIAKEHNNYLSPATFGLLHGEWFAQTRGLIERYLIYYSPKMLFIDGDYSPRHRVPDLGILYYTDLLFISAGLFFVIKSKKLDSKPLFIWLFLSPIPAVLSRDLISVNRGLNVVFPLSVLSGLGFFYIFDALRNWRLGRWALLPIIAAIFLFNIAIFLDRYFIHAPIEYSQGWVYGYKETFRSLTDLKDKKNYSNVVVTDYYGQPYIFYLFYNAYDPARYQKQAVLDQESSDVGTVKHLDNITFRPVYWPTDRGLSNSLFVGTGDQLPSKDISGPDFTLKKDIKFLDGSSGFRIVETR